MKAIHGSSLIALDRSFFQIRQTQPDSLRDTGTMAMVDDATAKQRTMSKGTGSPLRRNFIHVYLLTLTVFVPAASNGKLITASTSIFLLTPLSSMLT